MTALPEWLTPGRIALVFLTLFLVLPVLVLFVPVSNNLYEQVAWNRRKSFALCSFFVLLILILGLLFAELNPGSHMVVVPLAMTIAFIGPFFSYYNSDSIILRMSKARPAVVEEHSHPYLKHYVEGLSIAAGIPKPKLYVIEDTAPNAFATGRNPEHGVIAVTTGLLDKLDRHELEGVIAHEISHIKNYDILLGSIAVMLVGVIAFLSDWMISDLRYRGRRRSSSKGGKGQLLVVLIALVVAIFAPIIAQCLRLAVSRKREFLADASAAHLTRFPDGLASALEKLDADTEPLEVANKSTAHMYIINPLREHASFTNNLFATHPPTKERIAALRKM